MIEVLIPADSKFKEYENQIRVLYEVNQEKITDTNSFDFVRDNTFFYLFLNDEEIIGAIYFFKTEGKLFLNAFSKPKRHLLNLSCLNLSLSWFNCDIYAEAQNRASAFTLLRCGFKRVKGNLFVYKK
ncbi:hypothetical protein IJD44_05325 [bacterium]|nr:hypothetical protein [bacterium]